MTLNMKKLRVALLLGLTIPALSLAEKPLIIGKHIFGLSVDFQNDPVLIENRSIIHNEASHVNELNYEQAKFSVANFKHDIGSIYLTTRNRKTGVEVGTAAIDSSTVKGLTQPTAGTASGWGTLLYSESNPVNAARPEAFIEAFKPYFKNRAEMVKPYNYGWTFEVIVFNAQGDGKLVKNYAAGRTFATHLLAMPDGKTLYMLDAAVSGNLYVFIAEEQNSLSKGSLYVANANGNQLGFLPLGKTSGLKAKFMLKKASFKKFFSRGKVSGNNCQADYKYIETAFGKECLKIKNKRHAGIFDPVRVAAMLGVQSGFKQTSSLYFDVQKNAVVFKGIDGSEQTYAFDPESTLGSNYLLREIL